MKSSFIRLSLTTAVLVMVAVLLLPATSQADEFNLKTYITVSQPVQVPGAVLQPNVKYVFRRQDPMNDNHVIRVMNADENQVIATFFAISDQRLEPTDHTLLTFYETAPGYAQPVHSWFYPGRTIGYEFIYPKAKMTEITAHLRGAHAAEVQTAQFEMQTVTPQNEEAASAPAENAIAQNTQPDVDRDRSSEVTPAEPESTPAPAVSENQQASTATDQDNAAPKALPKTGGELPLIGLLGFAAIGLRKLLS